MRHVPLFLLAILVSGVLQPALSKPVDKTSAYLVAGHFMARWGDTGHLKSAAKNGLVCKEYGKLLYQNTIQTELPALYIINTDNQGFIIVSGDDAVTPILAYSRESNFDFENISSGLEALLHAYTEEIGYAARNHLSASEDVRQEWERYLNNENRIKSAEIIDSVKPMTTTKWGYGKPYNDLCPADPMASIRNGRHAPAGCAAVAMAQLLKFWNHPVRGTGSNSYEITKYGLLSADFAATTYDWKNMPDELDSTSAFALKNAVTTLIYHCGVSVNMTYDAGASGSFFNCDPDPYSGLNCVQKAFYKFFGYKNSVRATPGSYSDPTWKELIRKEIAAGRPVIYAGEDQGAAHALVIDGFDKEGRFSTNWGLFGFNNGFFHLNLLELVASETIKFNFISNALILTGIEPDRTLNTEDAEFTEPLKIWPNPASDLLQIDISGTVDDFENISVLNNLGMKILNIPYSGTRVQIPLKKMNSGMYFIRIISKGKIITKRFIVKK
jgi:hypothetical protein